MLLYPHPLDYVTGLKYALTSKAVNLEFRVSPDVFYVEEVIDFSRMGLNDRDGEYAVLRVYKRGVETLKAVGIISRALGVPASNVHFYGLKDKKACTISYIFIKRSLIDKSNLPVESRGIKAELFGFTKLKPRRSYYVGNKFRVVINTLNESHYELLKEIVKLVADIGLPSYYGYQRFGYRRYNSHVLGKALLIGREDLFAIELLRSASPLEACSVTYKRLSGQFKGLLYEEAYAKAPLGRGLEVVTKRARSIFISAYASYLFNLLLNFTIERSGYSSLYRSLPMPGCTDTSECYERIAHLEGVHPRLLQRLPCFYRDGMFKPVDNRVSFTNGVLTYEFSLKPGMFATIVLREIFKHNLTFE